MFSCIEFGGFSLKIINTLISSLDNKIFDEFLNERIDKILIFQYLKYFIIYNSELNKNKFSKESLFLRFLFFVFERDKN